MNFHRYLLLLSTWLALQASGQVSQPLRIELEHRYSENAYTIISLKEEGIALIKEKEKYEDGKKLWELTLLDSSLTKTWLTDLALEPRQMLIGYDYAPGYVYVLFRESENENYFAELRVISLKNHSERKYKIEMKLKFRLTHFIVVDNNCAFGGYVNSEPAILVYHIQDEKLNIVPGFFSTNTELLDVRANKNNTFNILMVQRTGPAKKLIFKTLDSQAKILIEDEMVIDNDRNILAGVSSTLVNDELIVCGTYCYGNSKQASGFYSTVIDPFNDQVITYHELTDLKYFLDYLPEKKAEKVRRKANQRKQSGRLPEFKAYITIHRIEENKKGFILFTETYIPTSTGSPNPYWNNNPYYNPYSAAGYNSFYPYGFSPFLNRYYNNPYNMNNTVPSNEIRMQQAVLVGLDLSGKIIWDESMQFLEMKMPTLEQVSDFIMSPKYNTVIFKNEKELNIMSKSPEEDDKAIEKMSIHLSDTLDVVKSDSKQDGGIRHWFGPYFYVWGYQALKDMDRSSGDMVRHIFYVNKVRAD